MAFCRLSKVMRPSCTAAYILTKLSSANTVSAASRATSVPLTPMATPTSATLRAGASLTPSPVMATTWPWDCRALTMRSLCSGVTLAKTDACRTASRNSSSLRLSRSRPVRTGASGGEMTSYWPIARAVRAWSPVIISTRMPARRQPAMASRTP